MIMKMIKGLKIMTIAGVFTFGLFAGGTSTYALELGSKANLDASTSVIGELFNDETLLDAELNVNTEAEVSISTETKTEVNVSSETHAEGEVKAEKKAEASTDSTETETKAEVEAEQKSNATAEVKSSEAEATSNTYESITLDHEGFVKGNDANTCSREAIIAQSRLSAEGKTKVKASVDQAVTGQSSKSASGEVNANASADLELQNNFEITKINEKLHALIEVSNSLEAGLQLENNE